MKNPPAVKIGIIVAFIQIAIMIFFLYIIMNNNFLKTYLELPLSIISTVAYLIVLYFLRATLIYLDEKPSIVNAFTIYIWLNIAFFLVNMVNSYLIKDYHLFYYTTAVYYVIVFYTTVQAFRVSQPVIKSGFTLFAVFLWIVILGNMALPVVFTFFHVNYHVYGYIHLVSLLPLISAILIFNSVDNSAKTPADFGEKPLFKDDPFG